MISHVKLSKDESTPTAKQQLKTSQMGEESNTCGLGFWISYRLWLSCSPQLMSSPWVTGFTDWQLIVALRVREANFTEEKSRYPSSVFHKLSEGMPKYRCFIKRELLSLCIVADILSSLTARCNQEWNPVLDYLFI
ncbi:Uncharacterized protein Rs2_12221 [Raphanus sativus]|nr:Uncharacterized protein Rs2_12221 [Raphanus sativus]